MSQEIRVCCRREVFPCWRLPCWSGSEGVLFSLGITRFLDKRAGAAAITCWRVLKEVRIYPVDSFRPGASTYELMMKNLVIMIGLVAASFSYGGESALTTTYQPMMGLRSGGVVVVPVTCHHWYASGVGSAVDLIHLRNVPPTDNPKGATEDLNLASRCGLKFSTNDLGLRDSTPMILLDASRFDESKLAGYEKEATIKASLESLRRCLPAVLVNTKVTLKCKEVDKGWLSKIVDQFNAAPRGKPFYKNL